MTLERDCSNSNSGSSAVDKRRRERSHGIKRSKRENIPPGLYVVATPIGNLRDITLRALDVLDAADSVICEDTRVTRALLSAYDINIPLIPYHEHNAERTRPRLLKRLGSQEILALVTDAGTPLVSDPGYKLVRQAVEAGIHVTVVPGPSAALAALVISALPTDRFVFHGFLPTSPSARRKCLHELRQARSTLVVFESPARLSATLTDMAATLGPRQAAVSRELTKVFEEVRRGRLDELAAHYRREGPPRGEVVVVVGPPHETDERIEESDLDRRLEAALETMSLRDAATAVAGATGFPRRQIYTRALELTGRVSDDR